LLGLSDWTAGEVVILRLERYDDIEAAVPQMRRAADSRGGCRRRRQAERSAADECGRVWRLGNTSLSI
jgi:hypothetical protein